VAILGSIKNGCKYLLWSVTRPGRLRYCPFCRQYIRAFEPFVNPQPVAAEADIISGQSTAEWYCPSCQASDRERLLYHYFLQRPITGKRVLHVAPDRGLFQLIRAARPDRYVCGDIDVKRYAFAAPHLEYLDVTRIGHPDGAFDLVICNHVLEHIPDDLVAMREIYRVLSPGGTAILMVPIGAKLTETLENPSVTDPDARARTFGQYDHVRIYSEAGYVGRLEAVGFAVRAEKVWLSPADVALYGINPRETVFVATKLAAGS
jgi:SAM-dependent methyltransferase